MVSARTPELVIRSSVFAVAAALAAVAFGCSDAGPPAADGSSLPSEEVTFSEHIAPIVFENCAACHRPGGSAPFGLLSYEDARPRAARMAAVTGDRFMPPWLPEPNHGEFAGVRRLSDDEIALIRDWAAAGAPMGDPTRLPPTPEFPDGWLLGEPDLVVEMVETYTLPPGEDDVFRNFVIPVQIPSTRYVRAVELRPSNPEIVHHAALTIDRTPSSRLQDQDDPEPGYAADMDFFGEAENPDGFFIGWTPGKMPFGGVEEMAWRLDRGTDLVLQFHMMPASEPRELDASVGLYFADGPPARTTFGIVLGSKTIDIPAGQSDYAFEDTYVLPVDVDLFASYPHAHFLGKEMRAVATLPDGTEKPLIWIKNWDFNRQDTYWYREPVFLPQGTTLWMRYTYDNSADNENNPNRPPQRVIYGPRSSDEMGELLLTVTPRNQRDLDILRADYGRKSTARGIAGYRQMLEHHPDDAATHYLLARRLDSQGQTAEAIVHYRESLRLQPDNAAAHNNLGAVLAPLGNVAEALSHFREAVRIKPDFARAHFNLGSALRDSGRFDEAIEGYREAVRLDPEFLYARFNLSQALAAKGNLDEALEHMSAALDLAPGDAEVHNNLGAVLAMAGRTDEAEVHFRRAVEIRPGHAEAHNNLGSLLEGRGQLDEAIRHYREALDLRPDYAAARRNLEIALAKRR